MAGSFERDQRVWCFETNRSWSFDWRGIWLEMTLDLYDNGDVKTRLFRRPWINLIRPFVIRIQCSSSILRLITASSFSSRFIAHWIPWMNSMNEIYSLFLLLFLQASSHRHFRPLFVPPPHSVVIYNRNTQHPISIWQRSISPFARVIISKCPEKNPGENRPSDGV